MPLELVLGGTRSGKSEVAERLAARAAAPVLYVATGSAGDPEMAERIALHRARRPAEWRTVETQDPVRVVAGAGEGTVLVDSLGGWLAGLMLDEGLLTDAPVAALGEAGRAARGRILGRVAALAAAAAERPGLTVVVAEEAGLGPVAEGAATRRYLDLAGESAQVLGARAARVLLVVAGRSLELWPAPSGDRDALVPVTRADGDDPALRLHGDALVPPGAEDFAVNVEPRPAWLEDELAAALRDGAGYPDERPAAEAAARRHGRSPDEVVVVNGAAEGFWLVAAATRPCRAVCVHPSFTEPEAALRALGHPVERAFRRPPAWALDSSRVPAAADLVVTGNPNNPTGGVDPGDEVAALARPGRVLVVDEAFMDFVPGEPDSLAGRPDLPGLVVVRSLTKLWGLAGVRAGYLLAPRPLAAALRRLRPAWNANVLALAAIRACSARGDEARAVALRVGAAREALRGGLAGLRGVETWPGVANFLLLRVPEGEGVRAALLRRGIAVRPGATFPGLTPDHLRVAVRGAEANARLVRGLEEALG